jgi:hypothetical protein
MKTKVNLFIVALSAFIIVYIFAIIFYILISFIGEHTIPIDLIRPSIFRESAEINFYGYFAVSIAIDILLVFSLIQLLKIGDHLKKSHFITEKTITCFKYSGKAFSIIAILGFINSIFYHYSFSLNFVESMLLPFFYHFMILIIGIGLLILEEIQKHSLLIKRENDLTI